MILDRNKELTEMIKTQGEEIKALRAMTQDNRANERIVKLLQTLARPQVRIPLRPGLHLHEAHKSARKSHRCKMSEQWLSPWAGSKVQRITIMLSEMACVADSESIKVTEKLTIKSLRPSPGDRIDVVFADKDEANKAK
jgi:hypothetical protein